jgi:hypothetical protein
MAERYGRRQHETKRIARSRRMQKNEKALIRYGLKVPTKRFVELVIARQESKPRKRGVRFAEFVDASRKKSDAH